MKKTTLLIAVFLLTFFSYAKQSGNAMGIDSEGSERNPVNWSSKSYEPTLKLQKFLEGARNTNLWSVLLEGSNLLLLDDLVCTPPSALNFDALSYNTVRINWTGSTTAAATYDVYYSTVATVPTAATAGQVVNLNAVTTTLNALNSNTTYFVWVRSSCVVTTGPTTETVKGAWLGSMSFTTLASLPYNEGFESANHGWEFGTGTHVNKWVADTAVKSTGLKSLYISKDNGVTHTYNISGTQVTHAVKQMVIPTGTQDVTISFDWMCKGDGFFPNAALDYFKVWVIPAAFVPTTGTLLTTASGGLLIRAREFNNSASFVRENLLINLSQFAGQNVKLVFEWRNDATDGNQPPAAIDNIVIKQVDCTAPTNLGYSNLTDTSVSFNWTGVATPAGVSYEVYYSSVNNPIIYDDQLPTTQNITASTAPLTGLTPDTKYYAWVRSKCSATSKSVWMGPVTFTTGQVPQQLPYVESFEGTHGWNLNANQSSTQVNKWQIGTAVHSGIGAKSLYVSKDTGTTYEYTLNQESASHAYRDILVNTGVNRLSLSFDWKCFGEGFTVTSRFDYFKIWMVPIDFAPTPGIAITAATNRVLIGKDAYNNKLEFGRENIEISVNSLNLSGQRGRLVFEWINNRSLGNQPPAAIDNIDLRELSCEAPSNLRLTAVTQNSALFNWTEPAIAANSYDLYYTTSQNMPINSTVPTHTDIPTPELNASGLTPNTIYYVWVRSSCGTRASTKSYWVGPLKMITGQIPATLPYTEDFEGTGPSKWTTFFSDNINKWVVGNAAVGGNAKSLYISNNEGVSHSYTLTRAQVSHAYRDIVIPASTYEILVKFDWMNRGEGTVAAGRDYMRVWLVPTVYMPTEGVNVTAALSRGVQIGRAYYLSNGAFVAENLDANVSRFAGQTMRLLFEWVNDATGGSQPPAAIDNIDIKVITCPKVSAIGACVSVGSTEIFWTAGGGEEEWEIAVYPTVDGVVEPDPADIITVIDEPEYVDTSLTMGTSYTVFVRAVCGPDDKSIWVKYTYSNISYDVSTSEPFCAGDETLIFPNVEGPGGVEGSKYGAVGCLGSTPNPVWYFLKIRNAGDLNFRIVQNTSINFNGRGLDVDFIAFGPFANMREACARIDLRNPGASSSFACSYSSAVIENFSIPNAEEDQIYVLLITNYVGTAGFIKLEQSGGSGVTDCSFNCDVSLGKDKIFCDVEEYEIVAKVSAGGDTEGMTFTWFKDGDLMDPATHNTDRITVTESGKYEVLVEKADCKENPKAEVTIKFLKSYAGEEPVGIDVCDNGDGTGDYDLKQRGDYFISTDPNPDRAGLEFSAYKTLLDAQNNVDPISLETVYTTVPTTVYFKIDRKEAAKCFVIFPYKLGMKEVLSPVVDFKYPAPICINNDVTIVPELVDGFTKGGSFSVDKKGLAINGGTGVIDVAASEAGKYAVTYTFKIPFGYCGEHASFTTEIEVFARFQISYDGECSGGQYRLRVIDLLQNIDMDKVDYQWRGPKDFTSNSKQIIVEDSGSFSVLVTTGDGCFETLNIELDRVDCMIPKGLSPNGDGINDSFDLSRYQVNSLVIFNRQGRKVYSHGIGYTNQWKGQSDGGSALPDGTYFYEIVTATESFTGWIQINK
ncbi:fibronectin type III domain-containing protein [Flavobacterium sp. JP2137]|uniref:fibronectin type III domain-containing protein n=1 Tax=Flavobacterium sp. JP2137 TaxID=3414510 RepID=UPI003D2FF646